MPVIVNRTYAVTNKDGQKLVFNQKEIESLTNAITDNSGQVHLLDRKQIEQTTTDTEVTLVCSGPKCAGRHDAEAPVTVSFREEEAARDLTRLPDEFFGFLKLGINTSPAQEVVFCGPACLRDYLSYEYRPPVPARIEMETAKREQAQQLSELNPHLSPADGAVAGIALAPEVVAGLNAKNSEVVAGLNAKNSTENVPLVVTVTGADGTQPPSATVDYWPTTAPIAQADGYAGNDPGDEHETNN